VDIRCGEGRGEKGRGCASKVEGDERGCTRDLQEWNLRSDKNLIMSSGLVNLDACF